MNTSVNQQLIQMGNIFNTLTEATNHFHALIKKKEFNQSIFSFSTIVEGFDAVSSVINGLNDEELQLKKQQIDVSLLNIAKFLEQGDMLKINEILQFSFIPLLINMRGDIDRIMGGIEKKKQYTIGVFSPLNNPKDFYPNPRLMALVHESEKQNVALIFFTSTDVDLEKKNINGYMYIDEKWERVLSPFPDVINNVGGARQSKEERKLRRLLPFTSFFVGNKLSLPKRMLENREYAELLVPFRVCVNKSGIYDFIEKNGKVVFKALSSNRGENIYFVTQKGSRFSVLEHKKDRILNNEAFDRWLESEILIDKGDFIVQRYVHTRTKENEPYHIRAHVQKNGQGEWELTYIYPRIGSEKSNLSNVVTDGRIENFHDFLQREYDELGDVYEKDILRLSLEVARHLDKIYGLSLDELGIDFAIDETGRYWMHEANNGPQTAFHEEQRAVNTIAYAKYIAENGIFNKDNVQKAQAGLFQSSLSEFPIVESCGKLMIGLLVHKITDGELNKAFVMSANSHDSIVYAFKPQDIDYDEMLIKGYFCENGKWVPKIVEYPDVIIDRIKLRGRGNAKWIYEELMDIPFTNEWKTELYPRSDIYGKLKEVEGIGDYLPSFQKVTRTRDVFKYIETFGNVLLKTESFTNGSIRYIRDEFNGKYLVKENKVQRQYNGLQLLNKFKEEFQEKNFIVQEDPRVLVDENGPLVIRVDVMLVEEWKVVNISASLGQETNSEGTCYLEQEYEDDQIKELKIKIEDLAKKVSSGLQDAYGEMVSEVSLIVGIDKENELKIIEVNPNGPNFIQNASGIAEGIMERAMYLIASTK